MEISSDNSLEQPINVKVLVTFYDYGEEYGSDSYSISGSRRDLARLLKHLRSDNCTRFNFERENGEQIDGFELEMWSRIKLPEVSGEDIPKNGPLI